MAAVVDNRVPVAAGIPPLPGDGDRAYVADATGLVEVAASGISQVIAKDGVRWCGADARGQVVWFVTDHGLRAFDLADRRIHPVIARDLAVHDAEGVEIGELALIIAWGKEQLGGESQVEFDVGVSIAMTAQPKLAMVIGCEGDRSVYCYDEHQQPSPSVVALQAHVKDLALVDPAYLGVVAQRGATRTLWSPPPSPKRPPTPPAIDRKRCSESPDQCAQLTELPSQPLWLVVTDNSRGDYFHETRQLWDPATGEFVRLDAGKLVRSKREPPDDGAATDYGGLRVAPSGMSISGTVFDATHVIYFSKEGGITCGWASGGWRIPGPTG